MQIRRVLLSVLLMLVYIFNLWPAAAAADTAEAAGLSPQIQGQSALLMDASSGRILYQVNPHERLAPASVTKIMTALLVIENGRLDQMVTATENASTTPESAIWLEVGEQLTRQQLLYALMLNSANDAAVALAESVAGSEEAFVALMNRRAGELGMVDSHFVNPHGLHDENHYTSAYDLALLSREAMKNELFRKVVSTRTTTIPWNLNDYGRLLINKNRLLYRYDDSIGIKNGYTKAAGNCEVGAARRGSLELIAVCLKSVSVYEDVANILDYGFENYTLEKVENKDQVSAKVSVVNGSRRTVTVIPERDLLVAVSRGEQGRMSYRIEPLKTVEAPVATGQSLGVCRIFADDEEIGTVALVAGMDVQELPPVLQRAKGFLWSAVKFLGKAFLILFACAYMIRIFNLTRRRRRIARLRGSR